MAKPKRPTDLGIARQFKRGESIGTIAHSLDAKYREWWNVYKVEAAIRRVMKRRDTSEI